MQRTVRNEQRAGYRFINCLDVRVSSLEKAKPGAGRQSAVKAATHFKQCGESVMVEPKVQKIPVADIAKIIAASEYSRQSGI